MIYVFKTTVKSQNDITQLEPHLKKLIGKADWNFDLEDCDNILRVESEVHNSHEIIKVLQNLGFNCEELPD
jgi:hypothetical protein